MKAETKELRFSIEGSFVTKIAREWFWQEHRPWEKVEEFLFSCMEGTGETSEQLRAHAMDVVFGRAKFIGNTADGTYALTEDNDMVAVKSAEHFLKRYEEIKVELDEVSRKYSNLFNYLSDNGYGYVLSRVNTEYGDLYDEAEEESPLLASYLKQVKIEQKFDDNYGWLEPDGTFHPVDWGEHQDFARKLALEKGWITEEDEVCFWGGEGDKLTERGWILLHSPARCVPVVTVDPEKRITKAQRDFLYGYYTDRGLRDEAEKYLEV